MRHLRPSRLPPPIREPSPSQILSLSPAHLVLSLVMIPCPGQSRASLRSHIRHGCLESIHVRPVPCLCFCSASDDGRFARPNGSSLARTLTAQLSTARKHRRETSCESFCICTTGSCRRHRYGRSSRVSVSPKTGFYCKKWAWLKARRFGFRFRFKFLVYSCTRGHRLIAGFCLMSYLPTYLLPTYLPTYLSVCLQVNSKSSPAPPRHAASISLVYAVSGNIFQEILPLL